MSGLRIAWWVNRWMDSFELYSFPYILKREGLSTCRHGTPRLY